MSNLENSNKEFCHSPSDFALSENDYYIYAAIKKSEIEFDCPLVVRYSVNENKSSAFMQPYHDVSSNDTTFGVYYAAIPSSFLETGKELKYEFFCGSENLGVFSVPVFDRGKMPPVIITEIYARPRGNGTTSFIELSNLTENDVDLYDYKLMMRQGKIIDYKIPPQENYFTNEKGKYIIPSGETAAIFFCIPKNHNGEDNTQLTKEGFCKTLIAEDFRENFTLSCDELNIFPCDICIFNEDSNTYELAPNAFVLPAKLNIYTLSIVPRNGGYEDAVFDVVINDIKYDHDTKTRRSSYFKADIKNPKKAVRISTGDFSTPGYFSVEQSVPNTAKAQPVVILPLSTNEFYTADGDYKIRFFALDVGERTDYANVFIKMPDKSYKKIKAHINESGEFEAVVNKKSIAKMRELAYYIKANGAVYESSLGSIKSPVTVKLIDNSGPTVRLSPEKEECLETDYKPLIHGEYFDISGIDIKRCELYVDNKNVTAKTIWGKNKFKYQVINEMRAGKHRIDLLIFDFKGNRTYIRRSFHISDCENSDMQFYRGEVHAHTADSDGVFFIRDAMKYARDTGKADFFAITEHSHYTNDDIYQNQIEIANDFYVPNKFAALYGFEMTWNNTTGYFGHMNVIGTDWIEHDIENVDLATFYNELKTDNNAVAMFNHPGYPWGNFDDYMLHDEEIDKRVCLAEIKGPGYDIEYMTALNKGWHIAPMFNEDNHAANWTTATTSTSVVIAPALTRANILNAFKKRRTYSTSDPTMKIVYKINDEWMGSHLDSPSELNITIDIQTESVNGIGKVNIVAEDNITIMSFDAASLQSFNASIVLPAAYDYYYLKITSQGQYTVTAPIWIENRKNLRIQNLSVGLSNDIEKPHTVNFSVVNTSEFKAKNVMADIYLTPLSGFDINTTIPYESVFIDKLDPQQNYTIMRRLPDNKYHRVTVIINGFCKKLEYADTEYVLVSPVSITEIMPNTSDKEQFPEIKNPFPYIKIHNNTNKELSLDDMLLRYWNKTGKQPLPNKTLSLKGMKISPCGDIVIWVKNNDILTVDDFNKFHNSNFIEGENLYVTTTALSSSTTDGRRLDIVNDGQVISRIHYNYGTSKDICKSDENKVLYYDYLPNTTATSYATAEKPKIRYEKIISNYTREKTLEKETAKTEIAKSKKPVSISNQTKNKVIGALSTVAAGAIVIAAATIKGNKKSKKNKKEQDTKKKS